MTASTGTQAAQGQSAQPRRTWRRRLTRLALVGGVLLMVLVVLFAGAEYYTSQPAFCGSCHIMDPYYRGWEKDKHSHSEKGRAACVTCHYAPGQQHTLMAKFRGLSQVASYFSGRAGAGRPKAHVADASCLTSGCHGDMKFMTAEIRIGNMTFVHRKHLDLESQNLVVRTEQLASLRSRLADRLRPADLTAVDAIAEAITPATTRNQRLTELLAERSLTALRDDVLAYAELVHTQARIVQLGNLRCASCHQFDPSLQKHFTLAKTTCYTCHFIHQPFNANTGRCLTCHTPPAGPVPVHYGQQTILTAATATSPGTITMDHSTILANNVNCVSCHADLIHGTGDVTRRDCQNCHDQARYLKDFDNRTVAIVADYHRVHAAGQHARCNDCHQLIDHRLTPIVTAGDAESLLAPVRRDCQHCHPAHHREQVEMLLGQGGFAGAAGTLPNPMTGARANCQACHTQAGADPKGEAVIRSTEASCEGCHGEDYQKLFARWREEIRARVQDAQALLEKLERQLSATTQPAGRDLADVARLVARARQNIHLVTTANGIHNRNYALLLLDQALNDLEQARRQWPP